MTEGSEKMLKALLLRKKINEKKKALDALKSQDFSQREAELAQGIEEVTEETDEETRSALEEAIDGFEAEKAQHDEAVAGLEGEIEALENELAEVEAEQETEPKEEHHEEERKVVREMTTRAKIFRNLSMEQRSTMFAREDVKGWLSEIRSCIAEKRALTNVGLTIPTVFIDLLKENIIDYSKLAKHVNLRQIGGNGRQLIQGSYPEAIWMDCCGELQEMSLGWNDLELGCWSVGGYFEICNATLEDSDIDLAGEILRAMSVGIGLALDKAILYGVGTRMPLGVVNRIMIQQAPSDYPATARPWVDLHETNVISIGADVEDADLFKGIILATGAIKGEYSRGSKVWCMNEKTYTRLMANALTIDGAGAIVSGVNGTMPVVGGVIEVLPFIPDDNIVVGYFDLYTLAERAGAQFASSEHVKFLQNRTVFRGVARYDGAPAIPEAFAIITINGATVTRAELGVNHD
jgi:HK97 family phage major capsid protein